MGNRFEIRLIEAADAAAALEIYTYYVLNTAVTFEYDVPSLEEFRERIRVNTIDYPWLVYTVDNVIAGYAYGSRHRPKAAYQWSPESTIYLSEAVHGKGIGTALYNALFAILKLQGYFNVYAGVSLPNEQSEGFHKALGFEGLGVFWKIGYKLGNWHDTKWFQLTLRENKHDPEIPRKLREVIGSPELNDILIEINRSINKND